MTKKRFLKLTSAIWHRWTADTRGNFKKDLPLELFLKRHAQRAEKTGFVEEYKKIKKRFTPYEK
jgi:hypothetical protein